MMESFRFRSRFFSRLLVLSSLGFGTPIYSAVITLSWKGIIDNLVEFNPDSVPAGTVIGAAVSGVLVFETNQYTQHLNIQASHEYGERYRFDSGLTNSVTIDANQWHLTGSSLDLIGYVYEPTQAFSVFAISERNSTEAFPGYVGSFEFGLALFATNSPRGLFDSLDLESANFELASATSASGFLSTRLWDENDDIVQGYYMSFVVTGISSTSVPEPSDGLMIMTSVLSWVARRRRGFRRHAPNPLG